MLSRITWPPFSMEQVVYSIAQLWNIGSVERTCIQTVNHPRIFKETLATAQAIRNATSIPISVSCIPFSKEEMEQLRETGVERIGIPLDAATKELFAKIKGKVVGGPYRWDDHIRALANAIAVFGNGKVSTHLIVGLGEVDRELLSTVQFMTNMGVYPSLFAFTPVPGSTLEKIPQPDLRRYHRIQLAHHLIMKGISNFDRMSFGPRGGLTSFGVDESVLMKVALSGLAFMTSGCPGCNRPYYNERPGGKMYNFPAKPKPEETARIFREILEEH
jgi:biotin synthase-related radical SAM superfamily protein